MRRCLFFLLLAFVVVFPFSSVLAQSDTNDLPWCRQPSDVLRGIQTRFGRTINSPIGYGPGGVRPVYQEYNHRIILMTSDTREVVQVVEDGIDVNGFELLGFSADCRYMAAGLGAWGERIETVIWDLSTHPATRLGSFDDGVRDSHRLDWSPDGRYVIVSTRNAAYLWNLSTNTQTQLVADVVSDCYRRRVGCNGRLFAHAGVQWDTAGGTVRVNLNRVGYAVTYDLNTGQPIGYEQRNGQPVTEDQAQTVEGRVESTYGCVPRIQYQAYNQRLVLKDWITGELVEVIEDNLILAGFQLLGWSATCQYIAAAIDSGTGLELVAWNVETHDRTSIAISDYVDRLDWSPVGNVGLVQTDGEGMFLWNIDTNLRTPIFPAYAGDRTMRGFNWVADRSLLVGVTSDTPNRVTAFDIFSGQPVANYDNPAEGMAGFSILYNSGLGSQWLIIWNTVQGEVSPHFSVWNLDTQSVLRLASAQSYRNVRFSPTGRYLYGGSEFWDVQNLSGNEPHPPTSMIDFGDTTDLQFVDEHIVETYIYNATQFEISRCIAYRTAYRWDLRSGELLSESPQLREGC